MLTDGFMFEKAKNIATSTQKRTRNNDRIFLEEIFWSINPGTP
ncbi:MAG: hypothetical protein P857_1132 [Candidatus Xenolissoclinum pacificiensis L6]|uniref:Uncharacterized protein n=1 Tax=Candidatus Xenolissoclinum pacificiensis L6 TaxID=1401685 RepID=W2V0K5_9RICK|nr:MAG: hypothetical protein P857_1132 [Candidatus Xenolissoclinum pacificiensis L6]